MTPSLASSNTKVFAMPNNHFHFQHSPGFKNVIASDILG